MSYDAFLQLVDTTGQPILGESQDSRFADAIAIREYSFGGSASEVSADDDNREWKLTQDLAKDDISKDKRAKIKKQLQDMRRRRERESERRKSSGSSSGVNGIDGDDIERPKMSLKKILDRSSPALLMAYCRNTATLRRPLASVPRPQFQEARIFLRKAGNAPTPTAPAKVYYLIRLFDVTVTEYRLDADNDDEEPKESITLAFRRLSVTYYPQNNDGTAGVPHRIGVNLTNNPAGESDLAQPFDLTPYNGSA